MDQMAGRVIAADDWFMGVRVSHLALLLASTSLSSWPVANHGATNGIAAAAAAAAAPPQQQHLAVR